MILFFLFQYLLSSKFLFDLRICSFQLIQEWSFLIECFSMICRTFKHIFGFLEVHFKTIFQPFLYSFSISCNSPSIFTLLLKLLFQNFLANSVKSLEEMVSHWQTTFCNLNSSKSMCNLIVDFLYNSDINRFSSLLFYICNSCCIERLSDSQ